MALNGANIRRSVTNYDSFVQQSCSKKSRTTTPDDIHPRTRIRKQAQSQAATTHHSRETYFSRLSARRRKRQRCINRSYNDTQSYLSAKTNGRCDKKKRTWLLARKIKATTSLLSYVRWQVVSSGDAVIENSVTAGRRISAASARVGSTLIDMAESKFQEIKRSISSWSLSTIKKPKLSGPKFKKPKLNIFTHKRKNRADQEVTANADESNECPQATGIYDSSDGQEVSHNSQPKIVVTLSDDQSITVNDSSDVTSHNESAGNDEHKQLLDSVNNTFTAKVTNAHSVANVEETSKSVLKRTFDNNDILFIDDSTTEDDIQVNKEVSKGKCPAIPSTVQVLNGFNDGADSWCDARSTLTAFDKDLHKRDLTDEEDENYSSGNFYDISDSQTLTPQSEKSYDDLRTAAEELDIPSSAKAREWVKSFDEDASKLANESLVWEAQNEHNLPRSKSDLELSIPTVKKWNKKEEIILNLDEGKSKKGNSFFKFFNKSNSKLNEKEDTAKSNSKETDDESAKRERFKKIFGVRRKLSIKSPIVDSKTPTYKDNDIHIAATPYALKNTVKNQENQGFMDSKGSLDVSDEAILYPLSKGDEDKNNSEGELVGESAELEKEIHKFLGKSKGTVISTVLDTQSEETHEINDSSPIKRDETLADAKALVLRSPENNKEDHNIDHDIDHNISDLENISNSVEEELSEYLELDSCNENVKIDLKENDLNEINSSNKLTNAAEADKSVFDKNSEKDGNCEPKTKAVESLDCDKKETFLQTKVICQSNAKKNSSKAENFKEDSFPLNDVKINENLGAPTPINVDSEGDEVSGRKSQGTCDDKASGKAVNESENENVVDNSFTGTSAQNSYQNVGESRNDDELNNERNRELNEKMKKGKNYFSKTFKNIKGNIFPEESKGKTEKKKLKIKFTSFGKKGKEKSNEVDSTALNVQPNVPMPTLFENPNDNEVNEHIKINELSESRSENELKNDDELNELIIREESKNWSFEIDFRDKTNEANYKAITEEGLTSNIPITENCNLLECSTNQVIPKYSKVNKLEKESAVQNEVDSSKDPKTVLNDEMAISDSQPVIVTEYNRGVIDESTDDLKEKESFITVDTQEAQRAALKEDISSSVAKESNIKTEELNPAVCPIVAPAPEKKEIINDLPKPKPRTKKNKYGYSQSGALPNAESCEKRSSQFIPSIVLNSEEEVAVASINAQNGSGHQHHNEPIYWEIDPMPKPSPRKKKGQSKQDIRDGSNLSINSTGSSYSASKQARNTSDLPDWIQQRPPIPCPRGKKQKSNLNLQSNDSCDVKMLSEVNVFGNSFSNIVFKEETITNNCNRWAGEDFYSGKAASIAYGVTSNVKNDRQAFNAPAMKQSLTSLKGVAQNKESSDLTLKRQRRRTAPGGSPLPAPRHQHTKSTIQALTDGLFHFTEILSSIGVGDSIQNKTEELLSDVLFAVFSLMGPEDSCTWGLCLPVEQNGTSSAYVSLGQVKTFLKEAFQVSTEKMAVIVADVKKRQVADVSLKLKVLEAKELRPKTVKGGSNPYATVSIPSTQQSCRTRMEHETLSPKWNQEFTLSVKNMHKDVIHLQVWHEFDAHITNHFSEVKDVQSALRLLKGTNALAHKLEAHLLGSVQVPVKQIKENGIDDWFPLEKITLKEERKPRGLVHIKGEVSAANSKKNYGERRSYDALLARFVYHYIKTITNNNAEEEALQIPWRGQLSPEAVATLAQHSIILGLNGPLQHFSWWIVGSRVPSADAGWQLYQLQKVQNNMTSKSYSESDLENLSDSFYNWTKFALYKLRNLRTSFPPSSGVIAKRQFASLLRICLTLQSHPESNALLQNKGLVDLLKQVGTAVTDYAKEWWSNLVEEQLRGVIKPEEQIQRVVNIASETFTFLEEVALFYGPTLLSEVSIPYFREIFILLTTRLNPCIRPPLMNIYSHLTQNHDCHQDVVDNVTDNLVSFVFENGSLLWTLYINLGRIHGLGNDLPKEVREESGIYEYHKWFNKAVRRWVDLAKQRALAMINKAVELDNFEAIDEYCNFSSSATDVIGIFTEVQIWWKYLSWPDPENSMVLLAKILEDICSYGMTYADLLKNKVENMFSDNPNAHELSLSKQICTGLNNIDRVKNDINNLPDMFGVNILSEKIRTSQTGGEEVANRFINNVNTLIESSAENMEAKVNEFIEVVIEKMGSALHNAVVEACEVSSDKPLLVEVLDPALKVIHSNMNDSNFRMFLHRLWDMLIHLFKVTITQNTDKRKASYFNGVFSIIENCLKFVSPSDGAGLTNEEAKSEEYYELVELLQCLRLSSEHLISKYYAERYDEQNLHSNLGRGELVARAYFTRSGKLTVEVIMAKDMQLNHECGSLSTLASQFSSQSQYVDAYVKVHLVPSEWFPNVHEVRTKIQRKSDPAVFEETFDFEVTQEDSGVESSFILFTLKDHNLGRSNTLIGEALIPLKELTCVDSNLDHGVQNMYLKITTPGIESGYQSLRALKVRTSDRVATAFLKRNGPRISVDNKFKGINNLNPEDEKSRSRSPRLLHKIFA